MRGSVLLGIQGRYHLLKRSSLAAMSGFHANQACQRRPGERLTQVAGSIVVALHGQVP